MSTPIADSVPLGEPTSIPSASAINRDSDHAEGENAGELDYVAVPRPKSVIISVRYHVRGRGKPLPYVMDDECDE
jgi:hypothetical protein